MTYCVVACIVFAFVCLSIPPDRNYRAAHCQRCSGHSYQLDMAGRDVECTSCEGRGA